VFQIYQHRDDLELLESFQDFFGCGRITSKGPNSRVMTYAVSGRRDLETIVIPFFEEHPLRSGKSNDFLKFREIVLAMQRNEHRSRSGFREIVELAFSMNKRGKQRRYTIEDILAEPSETVRRAPAGPVGDETVRSSWRHEEDGRNDRPITQLELGGGNSNA
jgi:LAGLIDADG endonuclease